MSQPIMERECIQRLLKDVRDIIKNPLDEQGIYYVHDKADMLKGYAMIIGPENTPYFGGFYFFEINYPNDYPYNPPKLRYRTNKNNIRFNPNLYQSGNVCISILNTWSGEQWSSCQTISTVLLTLCTLFCESPLFNEPLFQTSKPSEEIVNEVQKYNEIITYSNINIAICDVVLKTDFFYLPFFDCFLDIIQSTFEKNYKQLSTIIKNKKKDTTIDQKTLMCFYKIKVFIDYNELFTKLKKCKDYLNKHKKNIPKNTI